jgi:hypothetical protein
MCKGVGGITPIDFVPHLCGKSKKEEPLDGLLNTGRVCRGNSVEHGGSMWGSITAVTGPTSPITFDRILPVRTKDNGTRRAVDRITVHL